MKALTWFLTQRGGTSLMVHNGSGVRHIDKHNNETCILVPRLLRGNRLSRSFVHYWSNPTSKRVSTQRGNIITIHRCPRHGATRGRSCHHESQARPSIMPTASTTTHLQRESHDAASMRVQLHIHLLPSGSTSKSEGGPARERHQAWGKQQKSLKKSMLIWLPFRR